MRKPTLIPDIHSSYRTKVILVNLVNDCICCDTPKTKSNATISSYTVSLCDRSKAKSLIQDGQIDFISLIVENDRPYLKNTICYNPRLEKETSALENDQVDANEQNRCSNSNVSTTFLSTTKTTLLEVFDYKWTYSIIIIPDTDYTDNLKLPPFTYQAELQKAVSLILSDDNCYNKSFILRIGKFEPINLHNQSNYTGKFRFISINMDYYGLNECNPEIYQNLNNNNTEAINLNLVYSENQYLHDTDLNYLFERIVFKLINELKPEIGIVFLDLDAILSHDNRFINITHDSLAFITQRLRSISERLTVIIKCELQLSIRLRQLNASSEILKANISPQNQLTLNQESTIS